MRAAKTGSIKFDIDGRSAARIEIIDHKITMIVDLLQPSLFKTPEDETGLFDKLKTAKDLRLSLLTIVRRFQYLEGGKRQN